MEEFEALNFDFSALDDASLDFDALEATHLRRAMEESRREALIAFNNAVNAMTGTSTSASQAR